MDPTVRQALSKNLHRFSGVYAKHYGLEESILLHYFQQWILANRQSKKNFIDGRTWFYSSRSTMAKVFPYLSEDQIRRATDSLVAQGLLIKGNYNRMNQDRTLWYAFKDEEAFLCPSKIRKLSFHTDDAEHFGIEQALLIYHFRDVREGKPVSRAELTRRFFFFSSSKLRRLIDSLMRQGIIELSFYDAKKGPLWRYGGSDRFSDPSDPPSSLKNSPKTPSRRAAGSDIKIAKALTVYPSTSLHTYKNNNQACTHTHETLEKNPSPFLNQKKHLREKSRSQLTSQQFKHGYECLLRTRMTQEIRNPVAWLVTAGIKKFSLKADEQHKIRLFSSRLESYFRQRDFKHIAAYATHRMLEIAFPTSQKSSICISYEGKTFLAWWIEVAKVLQPLQVPGWEGFDAPYVKNLLKQEIGKHLTEAQFEHGYRCFLQARPTQQIQDPVAWIINAGKKQLKSFQDKEGDARLFAQRLEKYSSSRVAIDALSKHLEISFPGSQREGICIAYGNQTLSSWWAAVSHVLKRCDIQLQKEEAILAHLQREGLSMSKTLLREEIGRTLTDEQFERGYALFLQAQGRQAIRNAAAWITTAAKKGFKFLGDFTWKTIKNPLSQPSGSQPRYT